MDPPPDFFGSLLSYNAGRASQAMIRDFTDLIRKERMQPGWMSYLQSFLNKFIRFMMYSYGYSLTQSPFTFNFPTRGYPPGWSVKGTCKFWQRMISWVLMDAFEFGDHGREPPAWLQVCGSSHGLQRSFLQGEHWWSTFKTVLLKLF
jgi:hypothetical protein